MALKQQHSTRQEGSKMLTRLALRVGFRIFSVNQTAAGLGIQMLIVTLMLRFQHHAAGMHLASFEHIDCHEPDIEECRFSLDLFHKPCRRVCLPTS